MFDAPVTIAHAIQLAVAPVFLLTGVAAILNVFTIRLGRIIDRARVLHDREASGEQQRREFDNELTLLARRARLVHRAIGLCTGAALLVSSMIAVIFLSIFIAVKMSTAIAVLFVAATLLFILALLYFLGEVQLATHSIPIGPNTGGKAGLSS